MTAERLPRFTPSMVDHRYRVTLMADKYDPDAGRFSDTVTAIGPVGARKTAEDKWRGEYPDCVALHVEEVVVDPQFCDLCGFAWSVHDNSDPLTKMPFGCPTEVVARLRWGQ